MSIYHLSGGVCRDHHTGPSPDVLIIGAGLAGATVAHLLAQAGLQVLVIDGGLQISPLLGCHVGTDPRLGFGTPERERLVGALLASLPNATGGGELQRAQIAFAVPAGGSSTLWTGITERLDVADPPAALFSRNCLEPFYDEAAQLLGVRAGAVDLSGFSGLFSPLNIARRNASVPAVTAPIDLLTPVPRGSIRILPNRVALRLYHEAGAVTSVLLHDVTANATESISAAHVVVACDTVRSPALLAASGIAMEPGFPVGQWLADHPLAVARIETTTELGRALTAALAHEPIACLRGVKCQSVPAGVHALVLPTEAQNATVLHLYWYATAHPRAGNGLEFADGALPYGACGARTRFREPLADDALLASMIASIEDFAARLGRPLPGWRPRVLPLGAAMHAFGTLRSADGGPGVTDGNGRVHNFSNLHVAGAARIPCPCSVNPVLAMTAMAISTARSLIGAATPDAYPEAAARKTPTD
jgi:choline dehydrogenase-like flavoprotein